MPALVQYGAQYDVFSLIDQVLLYMMDGLLTPANTSSVEALEKVFVFCMVWSMGSSLTVSDDGTDYQKIFSDWWRSEWKKVSGTNARQHVEEETSTPWFWLRFSPCP